jgi:CO dehydrogenase/acetyl-CoA synthase gamma subunit (corrinoid Fe-S protein)
MNNNRKGKQVFWVVVLLALPLMGKSQTNEQEGHIWLVNNRGEAVDAKDSIVTRNFFDAEWVDIQADFTIDEAVECWLIFQPENGNAKAFKFAGLDFNGSHIQKSIEDQPTGTKVLVILQPKNGQAVKIKKNKLELRLL